MRLLAAAVAGVAFAGGLAVAAPPKAKSEKPAKAAKATEPEAFATFDEVPVGIAASRDGRTFVAFSRAIDPAVSLSVAEVKEGKPVAYPAGFKQDDGPPATDRLLAVQAVTVDAANRLWILDCAKVGANAVPENGPKLIGVDLATDKVVKQINFPADVAGKTSFLNDLRVDLTRGAQGTIYITDASPEGPSGLVVVDIASGRLVRRLDNHPTTRPDRKLVVKVDGQPLIQKQGPKIDEPFGVGADGIALSGDGKFLYYSPLTSHHLYRVSTDALADAKGTDEQVVATVEDLGDKKFAADGMLGDAQGRLYSTDYEHGAIHRRDAKGKWTEVARGMPWPDTMTLQADGTLLVTATQIHLSPRFHGEDKRQKPFKVYRVKTDSQPLFLPATRNTAGAPASGPR